LAATELLTDEDERDHAAASVPGWSENYLSQAYAPDSGIGVYLHRSRPAFDSSLWRDIVILYLPDQRLVAAKTFSAGTLTMHCETPWTRWTKRFRGAGRVIPKGSLMSGPATDGIHVAATLDLTYVAMSPPWDLGAGQRDQVWASAHYEQACRVSGVVGFDGAEIPFDGTGLRDHSWGPRDLSAMGRHVWLHGQFPDGRSFMALAVRKKTEDLSLVHAVVADRHDVQVVEVIGTLPFAFSLEEACSDYSIRLATPRGDAVITAEILQVAPLTFAGPNDMVLGVDRGPNTTHVSVEAQTRFCWDGEIGYGLSERSVLLGPDQGGTR
jgi:hypothetical protein